MFKMTMARVYRESGYNFNLCKNFVTPAQAGVHHRRRKFHRQVMDSRLRGNDE